MSEKTVVQANLSTTQAKRKRREQKESSVSELVHSLSKNTMAQSSWTATNAKI